MCQEVITKGVDSPPDSQTVLLHCAVPVLMLCQLPADVYVTRVYEKVNPSIMGRAVNDHRE